MRVFAVSAAPSCIRVSLTACFAFLSPSHSLFWSFSLGVHLQHLILEVTHTQGTVYDKTADTCKKRTEITLKIRSEWRMHIMMMDDTRGLVYQSYSFFFSLILFLISVDLSPCVSCCNSPKK